jgi:hypothetical protein
VNALTAPIVRLVGPLHERVLLVGEPRRLRPRRATRQYTGAPVAPSRKILKPRTVPDLSTAVDRPVDSPAARRAPDPRQQRVPAPIRAYLKVVETDRAPRQDGPAKPVEKWIIPGEKTAGLLPPPSNPRSSSLRRFSQLRRFVFIR